MSRSDVAFFLDTNICIYALKGRYPAIGRRMRGMSPSAIKIPSVVKAELLFGARKSRQSERTLELLGRFLFPFEVIPFGDAAAESYSRIRANLERRGKPVGPNDLIIAATVMAAGGTLITRNVREFRPIEDLPIEDWTS